MTDIINPDIFYWRGVDRYVHPAYMNFLIQHKLFAYPLDGGFVVGPSHDDGGIQIIQQHGDEYLWIGEMEGFEYLVNPFASEKYHKELHALNHSEMGDSPFFERYRIPSNTRIIDCNPIIIDGQKLTKWIAFGEYSQWIVNKVVTEKHLQRLHEINEYQTLESNGLWDKVKSWLSFKW